MSWMQYGSSTYEIGSRTMDPTINAGDVALSLAKLNRYTGHTNVPYSVAQHCLLVSVLLDYDPVLALYGLIHDVPETVVQDLSYPMKQALGIQGLAHYRALDNAAEEALYKVLNVVWPVPPHIHAAIKVQDWVASATEKRDLMPPCPREWNMLQQPPMAAKIMAVQDWKHVAAVWLKRFVYLHALCVNRPMPPSPQLLLGPPDAK